MFETKLRFTPSESGLTKLGQLEDLLDWLEPHLDGRELPDTLDDRVLLLLLVGMYRRVRAMVTEARAASSDGLRILIRSILEAFITACYIAADRAAGERRAAEYVATGIIERKKMGNAYLNQLGRGRASRATPEYQRVEAAIAKRQRELSALERRFGTPLELPDLEKCAMLGGATKPYAVGYRMFSGDVHADLRSVEGLISNAAGSLRISLTVENELAESTLRAAYVYLVGLMNTCNGRLALFDEKEAERFDQTATASLQSGE